MIGPNYLAGGLAVAAGVILLVGLIRIVRLMTRIVRTLAAAHFLIGVVANATEPVADAVGEIATNVAGIESVSAEMATFVEARTVRATGSLSPMNPALTTPTSADEL